MNSKPISFYKVWLISLSLGLALTATSVLLAQASGWEPAFSSVGTGSQPLLSPLDSFSVRNGLWGRLSSLSGRQTGKSAPLSHRKLDSGTIAGTVYYTGVVTGTHMVWAGAFTTTQGGPPVYVTVRSGPGPYTLTNIAEGVYYIMGGMDADDSEGPPDPATDPLGFYTHNPVTITAGAMITGVDVILLDPTPPPTGTGSISGWIRYTGRITTAHNIIVVASRLGEEGPPAYATVIAGVGPYTITNVADDTYIVAAFMDLGGDMGPPEPDEPFGWYDPGGDGNPDPVIVSGGVPVAGIDVTLHDLRRYIYLPLLLKQVTGQLSTHL